MKELADHIEGLARRHNVTVDYSRSRGGRACLKERRIYIPKIKSHITYALALHELGHILGKKLKHRIDQEVSAWEWAKENALHWNVTMQKSAARCLQSYINWANRRKGAVKPTPEHPIYSWVK